MSGVPEMLKPRRVLVVDDNVDSADTLAALLRVQGHETAVAYDGATAVDLGRSFRPQIVLLDICLTKGMDGYEVAHWLRREPGLEDTFFAALTGYPEESDQHRSQETGFDAHLVKPVNLSTLEKLLAQLD
jgi:CheY-like chemotaxis protein